MTTTAAALTATTRSFGATLLVSAALTVTASPALAGFGHTDLRAALAPSSAAGTAQPALRITDRPAEQRLVLQIDVGSTGGAAAGVVPRGGMLFRFRAAAVATERGAAVAQWSVLLLTGDGTAADAVVRLDANSTDVALPKPLGVRVGASDSLRLIVQVPKGENAVDGLSLQLLIDYEPIDGPVSRMPVLLLIAERAPADDLTADAAGVWEWRAPVSGRLMALAGAEVAAARELVLEDVATGEIIWRMRVSAHSADFARTGAALRPGVAIEAGRAYRLTLYANEAGTKTAGNGPQALLLPRAPQDR